MKKEYLGGLLVLGLVIGFLGRNQIRSILGVSSTREVEETTGVTVTEEVPTPATAPVINGGDALKPKTMPGRGTYWTTPEGFALYTYDIDTNASTENCTGVCAKRWPAYVLKGEAPKTLPKDVTLVQRVDGAMQFTFKSMPLYRNVKDESPDDMTGDGADGRWRLARPDAS